MERDIIPMAFTEGMAIAPWGAIGQGRFQRKSQWGKSADGRSAVPPTDAAKKVSAALEEVADQLGVESVTAVALAWVMQKYPYTYPIIGGRKVQ
jgi:aryl-alcohol dehydrogenase-like predicted oxidoreductase